MNHFYKTTLLFVLIFSSTVLYAQTGDRDKGIELYKRGDSNIEAIRLLESASKDKVTENDGEVWNYLGMAYLRQNKIKEALKALEHAAKLKPGDTIVHSNLAYLYLTQNKLNKAQAEADTAIRLDPKNTAAYYVRGTANQKEGKLTEALDDAEQALKINPNFTSAYLLKSGSLLNSFEKTWKADEDLGGQLEILKQSIQVLELCLKQCPQDEQQAVRENLETPTMLLDYFINKINAATPPGSDQADPNNKPLKIISKPRANYTDEARRAGVQGTITTIVLFGADSKIKRIFVVKGLGKGLDEEVVSAVMKVVFEPEIKNGKPVSAVKLLQYSFTIY